MSKIAILTNFMEFNPGYSLTGIVQDQARMLLSHGHTVHIFVNEKYNKDKYPALPDEDFTRYALPHENYDVRPLVPFAHLKDYQSINDLSDDHKQTIQDTTEVLIRTMPEYDYVFTHDFIFTGWFLPYGQGCRKAGEHETLKDLRWFHWIHSIPSAARDWWRIKEWGPRHKLVFPNKTDSLRVAEQYWGDLSDVRVIPHIKDLRSWWDFDPMTCEFLRDHPHVMQADLLKVYPASTDRLSAKRVEDVIMLLAEMKRRGLKTCLIIANQWATGRQRMEDVDHYYKIANRNGLKPHQEYIMTSTWKQEVATGIPKRMLRELFLMANLFIFPTREESFGLVGPEAALEGMMCVFNKSLHMMPEVNGMTGLYFDFGSYTNQFVPENRGKYLRDVASVILGRMQRNESLMCKTFHRCAYNWDALYSRYYEPFMGEAHLWA